MEIRGPDVVEAPVLLMLVARFDAARMPRWRVTAIINFATENQNGRQGGKRVSWVWGVRRIQMGRNSGKSYSHTKLDDSICQRIFKKSRSSVI